MTPETIASDLTETELAWLEGRRDPTATSDGHPDPAATWA